MGGYDCVSIDLGALTMLRMIYNYVGDLARMEYLIPCSCC